MLRVPFVYINEAFLILVLCMIPIILQKRKAFLTWKRMKGELINKKWFLRGGQTWVYSYIFSNQKYTGRDRVLGTLFDSQPDVNIGDEISILVNPSHPKDSFLCPKEFGIIDNPYGKLIFVVACLLGFAQIMSLFYS